MIKLKDLQQLVEVTKGREVLEEEYQQVQGGGEEDQQVLGGGEDL